MKGKISGRHTYTLTYQDGTSETYNASGYLASITATGAERVWVTHGYREPVVRWLEERGIEARAVASRWEGELDNQSSASPDAADEDADTAEEAGPV